jgi:hypothetical protein
MPIARRMPISRDFCTTDTTSTLAMPIATDSATNSRISRFEFCCALTAVKNCALVLIQLSAGTPVAAVMRSASCSAA